MSSWLILGIGVAVILLIFNEIQKQKEQETKRKKTTFKIETKEIYIPKEFIHLSEINDLIKKYGLDENDPNSFFNMIDLIIKEGSRFAAIEINKIAESEESDELKAQKILNKIRELKLGQFKMQINWDKIDPNSPKIFPDALEKWAIEFNLYDDLKLKPRDTIKKILEEKLFNYGIENLINKLKVKIEFIEKRLNENDIDKLKNLIEDIKKVIKKY